ncbi:response regulator [Geminicoccus harenae]|uniref:response regulator n=3 Tax=Geminicoccus harenae TaxID=2498453 RepID=UPI001C976195|nr:response regulator [Geminicoccus harenae]
MDIRQLLLDAFATEYREHLAAMRRLTAAGAGQAELAEIFRRAHSLKGAARAVDHQAIEQLAHRLESLLERVRQGELALDPPVVRAVLDALDAVEDVADDPEVVVAKLPVAQVLDALLGGAAAEAAATAEPPSDPEPADPEPPAPEPTPAPEPPADPAAELPPAPAPPQPAAEPGANPVARPLAPAGHETVRIRARHLDGLMTTGGLLLAQASEQAEIGRRLRVLHDEAAALRRTWERSRAELRRHEPAAQGTAGPLEAIDKAIAGLGRRIGELTGLQATSAWKTRRLIDQLQDDVSQARLIPAEEVFSGFGRMVRDLARESGKLVEFRMTGLELEADRMILQALKDPVMHVLRNAVAHGAELPEERERAGKPPVNRLALTLGLQGTRLRLEVTDDGRGLDFGRIRATAVAAGLLDAAEADMAKEAELARFLLRDGFSTARTVDRLSGRGMGLGVLQEVLARLQGDLEIGPNHPHGTRLEMSLPMSVVRTDLLLVACRDQTFALPAHAVDRVLRIRASEIATVEGRPVLRQGSAVTALSILGGLLGMGEDSLTDESGFCPVVILRTGRRRVAMLVDGLLEMRQAAVQEPPAGTDPVVAGTFLRDGRPILVLSPALLIDGQTNGGPVRFASEARKLPPSILVVDDSITTRTLEKSILEAEGFRVRLAVDGQDALDSLRREPADLVISDVEMPRMDGFDLLQALKADAGLATIPVIMLTSRDARDQVQRGLELGADAYVTKQGFEQRTLLETICQFVDPP